MRTKLTLKGDTLMFLSRVVYKGIFIFRLKCAELTLQKLLRMVICYVFLEILLASTNKRTLGARVLIFRVD